MSILKHNSVTRQRKLRKCVYAYITELIVHDDDFMSNFERQLAVGWKSCPGLTSD